MRHCLRTKQARTQWTECLPSTREVLGWWHRPVTPALGLEGQESQEGMETLGYTALFQTDTRHKQCSVSEPVNEECLTHKPSSMSESIHINNLSVALPILPSHHKAAVRHSGIGDRQALGHPGPTVRTYLKPRASQQDDSASAIDTDNCRDPYGGQGPIPTSCPLGVHTYPHTHRKIKWDTTKAPCSEASTDSDPLASGQRDTEHYHTWGNSQSFCCILLDKQ